MAIKRYNIAKAYGNFEEKFYKKKPNSNQALTIIFGMTQTELFCVWNFWFMLLSFLLFPYYFSWCLSFKDTQIKSRNQSFSTNVDFIEWKLSWGKKQATTTCLWACAHQVANTNDLFQEQDCFGLNQVTRLWSEILNKRFRFLIWQLPEIKIVFETFVLVI